MTTSTWRATSCSASRARLIGDFRKGEGTPPAADVDGDPGISLDYTFVMEPGEAVLPHPPIK